MCIIIINLDSFLAFISTIVATLYSLFLLTQRRKENRRISDLVQVALDTLRIQEFAHYSTDPLTAPKPYLSSVQLRDLVLQNETSVNTRRRLWDRVERIVESNANVQINLEEIESGDETKVWRWVGGDDKTGPNDASGVVWAFFSFFRKISKKKKLSILVVDSAVHT